MNNKIIIGLVVVIIIIIGIFITVQKSNAPENTQPVDQTQNQTSTTATTTSVEATSTQDTAGIQPALTSVTISNYSFSPKTVTIKKNTMVTWTNEDSVKHTVTGVNGGPSSDLIGKGESYSYTFTTSGTYNYYCKPHPMMKGTIVVTE